MRAFSLVFAGALALSACAGRAQIAAGDEPTAGFAPADEPSPDTGSAARGGAGGSRPGSAAGSDAADAGRVEAGSGGELAHGGAADEDLGDGGHPDGVAASGSCAMSSAFATGVLDHAFGGGQNANQTSGFPQVLFGPPVANDPSSVVSLGNGGWVVLEFAGYAIVDGPGVDFTVFENPLPTFKELATVAVSDDAQHWTEFPCIAAQDATDYGLCAGVGVVYASPTNGIDPLDPAVSGGDHYDLAAIGVGHARYVRITDRVDLTGNAGVFDLDAVAVVHAECL